MSAAKNLPLSDAAAQGDLQGALVSGRYRVRGELGRGGAAAVFEVDELATGKRLALKRLLSRRGDLDALFAREYYTLCSIKHLNVVEAYDYGSDADGPYYTMELLTGSDLSASGPMPWLEACRVIMDGAAGLSPLHARRLVHRDVGTRNLWRTANGKVKVIDFGAITAFGTASEIVGTPPFVAPESVYGNELDQRTDLYALGATLYFLLTGSHAFPARTLRELPRVWAQPWVPASHRVRALEKAHLPEVPAELDALIEALLSTDPKARPSSTGDLIDRIAAISGLTSRSDTVAVELSWQQAAFVGRDRELRHLRRRLGSMREGTGCSIVIEGRSGEGKSRLLNEFALEARVAGVNVLKIDAAGARGVHGVALALANKLLDVLPEVASALAKPYERDLTLLSHKLSERLGEAASVALPTIAGESRARVHDALSGWFLEVSKQEPLLLLVDGLTVTDEASAAWLLSLGQRLEHARMMLVVTFLSDTKVDDLPGHRALLQQSSRVLLRPLESKAARELLGSLFGEVPHLSRLSERLQRTARGNPAHLLEVAQHLVEKDVIGNAEGTWQLPQDVPEELLAFSRGDAQKAHLSKLSETARKMARALSVRQGDISLSMCLALTESAPEELYPALSALMQEGFLIGAEDGYRFSDDESRLLFLSELHGDELSRIRRSLGKLLLASEALGLLEELEARVLLLAEDHDGTGAGRITQIARTMILSQHDLIKPAVPLFEQALSVFRTQNRAPHELVSLLAVLASAGYYSDRKLFARYSEETLAVLNTILCIPTMQRLRPILGRKLSFYVGMVLAAVRFRRHKKSPCVPTLKETTLLFMSVMLSFAGISTILVDPRSVRRAAAMVEPFTVLAHKTPSAFIYQSISNLAATVEDNIGPAREAWLQFLERVRDPAKSPVLNDVMRTRFVGGALYACGVLECWRDSDAALRCAEELESFPIKFYRMCADQLRTVYYAQQGNMELYEQYKRRVELNAIQRGSSWQAELWAPGAAISVHLRTFDALGMKQSIEQLTRVSKTAPSLQLLLQRARGGYLLLRRKYEEALPLLAECLQETPVQVVGWARTHGVYARALNALGQHARAKEICERALAYLAPSDLDFPAMNLGLQIEYALAYAGLGETNTAVARWEGLLERFEAGKGPLTMGALHEARARIAIFAKDEAACREHMTLMESFYRGTGIPSLVARCESFAKEVRHAFGGAAVERDLLTVSSADMQIPSSVMGATGMTMVDRALSDASSLPDFARRVLTLLMEGAEQPRGALWACAEGEFQLEATQGMEGLPSAVRNWIEERQASALADDVTQTAVGPSALLTNPDAFVYEGYTYRFELLRRSWAHNELAGAVLVGSRNGLTPALTEVVLEAVGRKLHARMVSMRSATFSV